MIVITGAAGFIGSRLVEILLKNQFNDLVLVDDFQNAQKQHNLRGKENLQKVDRKNFYKWIDYNHKHIQFVFHIGARTDTAEFNFSILEELNLNYSKMVWNKCCEYGLPLIYASSAATYGAGEYGFDDCISPEILKPLNPYGISKNEFDKWVLKQKITPYFWAGFKFFNVYGPNEYHKGRMASVVFHAFNQICKTGYLKLFKSHNSKYADGEQKRDFIYVDDVIDVLVYFMKFRKNSGIYNLGTGQARSFNELANTVFYAMKKTPSIQYIDTPDDIREKYQYFTEAKINKLKNVGYHCNFTSLEDGIYNYVNNYLKALNK
jgi:ADP-L-glycero-D-manno-heptose 6-epimerase